MRCDYDEPLKPHQCPDCLDDVRDCGCREPEEEDDESDDDDEIPRGDMWDPMADPDEYCDECDSYICDCWDR